jgi:hypothetical protein
MAEQHDATTLQDADVITPLEGAGKRSSPETPAMPLTSCPGSSKDTQQSISPDAPVNLPLRQQMHHQRHMPKIHDITEKFTKACSGTSAYCSSSLSFNFPFLAFRLLPRYHKPVVILRILTCFLKDCLTDDSA